MKKTKLKLKKSVWITLGGVVVLIVAIIIGVNVYQTAQYHKTNETFGAWVYGRRNSNFRR